MNERVNELSKSEWFHTRILRIPRKIFDFKFRFDTRRDGGVIGKRKRRIIIGKGLVFCGQNFYRMIWTTHCNDICFKRVVVDCIKSSRCWRSCITGHWRIHSWVKNLRQYIIIIIKKYFDRRFIMNTRKVKIVERIPFHIGQAFRSTW